MKATRFTTLTALGIALAYLTAGCHPQNMRPIYGSVNPTPEVNPMPPIQPAPTTMPTETPTMIQLPEFPGHTNWIENPDQLKDDTIHFAYDSSVIPSGEKSKISSVADFLKSNPNTAVRVEGNCDERGTEEYNRSLGERRALAAREALVGLGITADRVDTISYGEDKPVDPGHNQAAWKQNRRDDFVVLTPPAK